MLNVHFSKGVCVISSLTLGVQANHLTQGPKPDFVLMWQTVSQPTELHAFAAK